MSILGQFDSGLYGKVSVLKLSSDAHTTAFTGGEHGAVTTATANMLMRRDASGRVEVVAPAGGDSSSKVPTTAWVLGEISGGGGGTVLSVGSGVGLTGGPIINTGTLDLENTSVVAGTYTIATITVDAQGRLTAASEGTSLASITGTPPITITGAASTPIVGIVAATGSVAGSMSAADKSKLDNATQSGINNALMIRSVTGKAEVTDPTGGEDIMNYQYWQANRVTDVSDLTGITISTGAPTGGSNGDLWFQY